MNQANYVQKSNDTASFKHIAEGKHYTETKITLATLTYAAKYRCVSRKAPVAFLIIFEFG